MLRAAQKSIDLGAAVSATTVAHKFRLVLWIDLYILLARFPLFSVLLQPEDSHPLATLDTTTDGVAPAVAISSKRLPVACVNACKLQITLTDILKAQCRATYWATPCNIFTIQGSFRPGATGPVGPAMSGPTFELGSSFFEI